MARNTGYLLQCKGGYFNENIELWCRYAINSFGINEL